MYVWTPDNITGACFVSGSVRWRLYLKKLNTIKSCECRHLGLWVFGMFGPYPCKTLPFRGTPRRDLGAPPIVRRRPDGWFGWSVSHRRGPLGGGARLADAVGELDGGEIEGCRRRHHPRDVAPTPGAGPWMQRGRVKQGKTPLRSIPPDVTLPTRDERGRFPSPISALL